MILFKVSQKGHRCPIRVSPLSITQLLIRCGPAISFGIQKRLNHAFFPPESDEHKRFLKFISRTVISRLSPSLPFFLLTFIGGSPGGAMECSCTSQVLRHSVRYYMEFMQNSREYEQQHVKQGPQRLRACLGYFQLLMFLDDLKVNKKSENRVTKMFVFYI